MQNIINRLKEVENNNEITGDLLYTKDEVLELDISYDKLKDLVKKGVVRRVKCTSDRRFSFFLKTEIDPHVNKNKNTFYFENVK
jgi:hypothetical protein